jgi:hypothetical protein
MTKADYPDFISNKQLLPKKDLTRINSIPKKKLTQSDISSYAANLFNKIMTKGGPEEITHIKSVISKTPGANVMETLQAKHTAT